jgi:hypothetical protein
MEIMKRKTNAKKIMVYIFVETELIFPTKNWEGKNPINYLVYGHELMTMLDNLPVILKPFILRTLGRIFAGLPICYYNLVIHRI